MPTGAMFRCPNCQMVFQSEGLLSKHRSRFCVAGGSGQDAMDLLYGGGRRSAEDYFGPEPHRRIQDNRLVPQSEGVNILKVEELRELKARKRRQRERHRWEDNRLVEQLEAEDRWETRSNELRNIRGKQYAHRDPIDDLGRSVSQASSVSNSNSTVTIPLPPDDDNDSPRQDGRRHMLRMQVQNYGRNLADLKTRNHALVEQRADIDRRLGRLRVGGEPSPIGTTSQLVSQVQLQEERNQRSLVELKQQLQALSQGRSSPGKAGALSEISAMRQAYLRQGGSNPDILSQLADLEAETIIATNPAKHSRKPRKSKTKDLNELMLALELENHRLRDELRRIEDKNNFRPYRKDHYVDEPLDSDIRRRQQEYLRKLTELQQEIDLAKQQVRLERYRGDAPNPAPLPAQSLPQLPPAGADVPYLMQPTQYASGSMADMDPLAPAPYDHNGGFVVFYDFVSGLDVSVQSCRLVVGLYNNHGQYGEPTLLPSVYCQPAAPGSYNQVGMNAATFQAKQPVPRCPSSHDLALVVELQLAGVSDYGGPHMSTRAWCKLPLFDTQHRLLSGRWKIPLRTLPIQSHLSSAEVALAPQFGLTELYLRLVNLRDADTQSLAIVTNQNSYLYRPMPQDWHGRHMETRETYRTELPVPPPPSVTPPRTPTPLQPSPSFSYDPEDKSVTLQVDRVKHAEAGEGKVRLTVYYSRSGEVAQSSTSALTCSTTSVQANYRHGYHIFGQQEAVFHDVSLQADMVLVARFYLRRRAKRPVEDLALTVGDRKLYDDETLVAWGTMPLMIPRNRHGRKSGLEQMGMSEVRVRTGTHLLKLYEPPVPDLSQIPLEEHWVPRDWPRYCRRATLRLCLLQGPTRPGSLTPSEASEDEEHVLPQTAWLPLERHHPPNEPFNATDGFDLYIDGCQNLPDSVTVSRVAGRVLDRRYQKIGKDISTGVRLDSDIYNPFYDFRVEFREPNMPPSATLLLKVYTIDRFHQEITVAGYATLNVFTETGTEKQPTTDTAAVQVSLNEGAHQLRLYHLGPNGVDPLTESCLRNRGVRIVPCATILVRLIKAPIGPQGKPLEAEKVPQVDWGRMGLWQPRPSYNERAYYSMKCRPTHSEIQLYHTIMRRTPVSTQEAVVLIAKEGDLKTLKSERSYKEYIRMALTKLMDVTPMDLDLTYVAQYSPKQGFKVAVDGAMNLPWANFTHAMVCCSPPAAFYQGHPHAAFDKPQFTQELDLNSTSTAPRWLDGYLNFPARSYHRFLVVVIHLQEIDVSADTDSYKYSLRDQAWTAVQVFSESYVHTETYQLPLYQGAPLPHILKQLTRQPIKEWTDRNASRLEYLDQASVIVRLCDARRDDELPAWHEEDEQVNTNYLPQAHLADYKQESRGSALANLVPQGRAPKQFIPALATKFKSLVYKLYEEGQAAS